MTEKTGTVWFIGAGPGDPDLITVKGKRLIEKADLVLYAGSLVPPSLVASAKAEARVVDSAPLNLEETHALMRETALWGGLVARVHTGDPALYGAIREQMELLRADGVNYAVVPGVSAAFAAAAAAGASFTVPGLAQSLCITRLSGRTPVPDGQSVKELARHKGSLAVYLSAADAGGLQNELEEAGLPPETPVVIAYRVGWPEEKLTRCALSELAAVTAEDGVDRQTVFLVLPGETGQGGERSSLYDSSFSHGYRKGGGR